MPHPVAGWAGYITTLGALAGRLIDLTSMSHDLIRRHVTSTWRQLEQSSDIPGLGRHLLSFNFIITFNQIPKLIDSDN